MKKCAENASKKPRNVSEEPREASNKAAGAMRRRGAAPAQPADAAEKPKATKAAPKRLPQSFRTTKSVLLRLLGVIYLIAFKVAYDQNPGLIGSRGPGLRRRFGASKAWISCDFI